jgi:hypothetical protein
VGDRAKDAGVPVGGDPQVLGVLAVLTLVALALGPETVRRDLDGPARRENLGPRREPSPTVPSDASSR